MFKLLDSGKTVISFDLSIMKRFDKFSVESVLNTAITLIHFPISLIALLNYTSCHLVLQKIPLIRYFCKTWLQLVFLWIVIRERRRSGKVLETKYCFSCNKDKSCIMVSKKLLFDCYKIAIIHWNWLSYC